VVLPDLRGLQVIGKIAEGSLTMTQKLSKPATDLSNTRYEGGVTSYLEVIRAQNAALSDKVTAVRRRPSDTRPEVDTTSGWAQCSRETVFAYRLIWKPADLVYTRRLRDR